MLLSSTLSPSAFLWSWPISQKTWTDPCGQKLFTKELLDVSLLRASSMPVALSSCGRSHRECLCLNPLSDEFDQARWSIFLLSLTERWPSSSVREVHVKVFRFKVKLDVSQPSHAETRSQVCLSSLMFAELIVLALRSCAAPEAARRRDSQSAADSDVRVVSSATLADAAVETCSPLCHPVGVLHTFGVGAV